MSDGVNTTSYTAVVRGDLDASGTITTIDVRRMLTYCVGSGSLTDAQLAASDLLTDQRVNTNDARALLTISLQGETMQFTQTQVVTSETFINESAFATFLSSAQRDTLLGGLTSDLVPQGLAQSHTTGLTYMSAYSGSGGCSAVLVFDAMGRFCAEYMIYNEDGTPCTKHLGGVAVSDTTLFLSYDGNSQYRVAAIPLGSLVTVGTQKVVANTFYTLPVSTSFLSYYDGWLWAGNFYLPSSGYDLMREINYTTTANGEEYGCYIAGFNMSAKGDARLVAASGQNYAIPDVLFAAPQKVQGMAFDTKTNTVILSHSWGRRNNSKLAMYTVKLSATADTTITLGGKAVPCYLLVNPRKTVTTMPMTEGITLDGVGNVRVLYESGANKYSDGLHRTDYIWKYLY